MRYYQDQLEVEAYSKATMQTIYLERGNYFKLILFMIIEKIIDWKYLETTIRIKLNKSSLTLVENKKRDENYFSFCQF